MRVPILFEDSLANFEDDPAAKRALSRRSMLLDLPLLECVGRPCPRRVKAGLSILLCLAIFLFLLYLDLVALLFWESLRRHSPDRSIPLVPSLGGRAGEREPREALERRSLQMREALNASLSQLLRKMPAVKGDWCQRMVRGELDEPEVKRLGEWRVDESQFRMVPNKDVVEPVQMPEHGCSSLRRLFPFHERPLSMEEGQFPLAYGLVVHKSALQVSALLSAIYQPQNVYCLAVDEGAEESFKAEMNLLGDCFPNVFVLGAGKVQWCKFGVVRAVFSCLRYLSGLIHGWRYYQYLSGVDLPLKTNLEMVRILKQLNGTINAEVLPFETDRVQGNQVFMNSPLTLWKSSLSALLSREAVDSMVGSEKVSQFLRYLQYGHCADEALWASIGGNPKELPIPGGFDASFLHERLFRETYLSEIRQRQLGVERQRQQQQQMAESKAPLRPSSLPPAAAIPTRRWNQTEADESAAEPFRLATYYISRYQVWTKTNLLSGSKETKCKGKFIANSCVFGIGDLPNLVGRPEMVAHKMYLDHQPAAYFCLWKQIHERALDWQNQRKFQGKVYAELPTVKMARGAPEEELRFFFD